MRCLSFGGLINSLVWWGFSEMLCDLSNEIPLMKNLDTDLLFSPTKPEFPLPNFLYKDVPYAKARPMAVKVSTSFLGQEDCYIDNIINIKVY